MDRLLYIAMNGANQSMQAQTTISHNLANASTTGFQADLDTYTSLALHGTGFDSRVYNQHSTSGVDFSKGSMMSTGRDLDVAIQGDGYIAVQAEDGSEAYTRAGDLRIDQNGFLTTGTGLMVLGEGGPVAIPPYQKLDIGSDGSVSIIGLGQSADNITLIDRIKLVNPDASQLQKGGDGLLRIANNEFAEPDLSVRLVSGMLEASNVNAVSELVSLLDNSRSFEMQVKVMRSAEDADEYATKLMRAK